MGNLDRRLASPIKMLYLGDSKSGKTGSLASLAKAGYNPRILDFDNGADILVDLLRDDKAAFDRVYSETLTDTFKMLAGRAVPTSARAWSRMTELLNEWKVGGEAPYNLGKLTDWTSKEILVLDSLGFAGNSAMRFLKSLNGTLASLPSWKEWREPQALLENLLAMLYSEAVRCNVIVISHIVQIGEDVTVPDDKIPGKTVKETRPGSERGYAVTLGKSLSPRVGRYFNSCIMARSVPFGESVQRRIFTDSRGIVELGNSAPSKMKPFYSIATGMAEIFAALRSDARASSVKTPDPSGALAPQQGEKPHA